MYTLATTFLLTTAALALPFDASPPAAPFSVDQLLQIVPNGSSCAGALFPNECRTASQAAPLIISSFTKYNITHAAVQAALISLMAYETGDFKYGINHWPGILGQGTRNMQSPEYNVQYATSLGFGRDVTANLQIFIDTLTQDKYSWASAAWFVTSQCPYETRIAMWNGEQASWESYLETCVGTSVNEERTQYWQRAIGVLVGR